MINGIEFKHSGYDEEAGDFWTSAKDSDTQLKKIPLQNGQPGMKWVYSYPNGAYNELLSDKYGNGIDFTGKCPPEGERVGDRIFFTCKLEKDSLDEGGEEDEEDEEEDDNEQDEEEDDNEQEEEGQNECADCKIPSKLKCVNSFINNKSERIMNGIEADPNSWPWLVQLWDSEYLYNGHFCGGSILNEEWIITAAHCVERHVERNLLFKIRAGTHSTIAVDNTAVIRNVLEVILYDDYDTKINRHDLALLKIEKLEFNDVIVPACFPHNFTPKTGQKCWAAGWGIREFHGPENSNQPATLRSVDLDIKDGNVCAAQNEAEGYQFHLGEQICSGNKQ